jgi:conjugal transfer pilus assembly protein TraV
MNATSNIVAALAVAGVVAACGNLSGLGGTAEYGCKAPEGVKCDSVSGNYANALHNNLPSQRQGRAPASPADPAAAVVPALGVPIAATAAPIPGLAPQPLRSEPRVLRLWIKPWEDTDHDLHDQSFVYVQTDRGHWRIEHVQRRAQEGFAPVRPPPARAPVQASTAPALPVRPNLPAAAGLDARAPVPGDQ